MLFPFLARTMRYGRQWTTRSLTTTTARLWRSTDGGEWTRLILLPSCAVGALSAAVALQYSQDSTSTTRIDTTVCSCEQAIHAQHPQESTPSMDTFAKEAAQVKSDSFPFHLKQVYDIEQVLGEGTYGMVYRARRKLDGVTVALKAMNRELTGKTDFEREVAALQLLSKHDHIVQLYDLHRDEHNYYLAMELIDGGELFEHLVESGPFSEAVAAGFLRQFAEAISFVHSSGLTHSDLKPENLMIAKSSNQEAKLKVVDFGCACTHDLSSKDLQLPAQEFAMGCSFLHQVALGNQFEMAKILMERPTLLNFRDYDRRTALHIAASEGHVDICRFLVQRGARINRSDRWGGSPLDDAMRGRHADVIKFLRQHGAKLGSTSQATNFITAASEGDKDEVAALLEYGDIDLNEGDYDGRTALHLAAGEGRLEIVEMLCSSGANVNVQDRWGNRPLDDAKAAKKHSAEIMAILKKYGVNASSGMPTAVIQPSKTETKEDEPQTSGTIAYWPPELFAKRATHTPASDMWAAGVIMYLLLTGSHPFDKHADQTDDQIKEAVIKVGADKDSNYKLMDELVFDERIDGLSDSCIELMRQLMHPDPDKRMTSDDFLRHPWIQGLTVSWKTMGKAHEELKTFWQKRFRAEVMKKFGISGKVLSEKDLETIFQALDLKKNGVLELEEIQTVFRDLGVSDKNIRNLFACSDLDGSGVISWDEFRALMKERIGDGPGLQVDYLQQRFKSHILNKFKGDAMSNSDKLREIFNAIDLEGNGVLNPHEIRVVLRSAGEPEDVISRIVASLDINRDGKVSWDEFLEIMGMKDA